MSQGVKWVDNVGKWQLRNSSWGENWQNPFGKQQATFRKFNMWSAILRVCSFVCSLEQLIKEIRRQDV